VLQYGNSIYATVVEDPTTVDNGATTGSQLIRSRF
jgi:hypothetical protein